MHIAIVTEEFAPFIETTVLGSQCAFLSGAFPKEGHTVRAIFPLPTDTDLNSSSLARRLMPIIVNSNGRDLRCIRYDGRTPDGVEIHLIEIEEIPFTHSSRETDSEHLKVFCRAAQAVIDSLSPLPDCCISMDATAQFVPLLNAKKQAAKERIAQLAILTSPNIDPDVLAVGLNATDRVALWNSNMDQDALLSDMLESGHAVAVQAPSMSDVSGPTNKVDAKAAFQVESGLPVRPDVPLLMFTDPEVDPFEEVLKASIINDIQVVVPSSKESFATLAKKFPDRLAVVRPVTSWTNALTPVDGCIIGGPNNLMNMSLACGAVPVIAREHSKTLVDLEPTLKSGSGIIVDNHDVNSFCEGIGRLIAGFQNDTAFHALSQRLPRYVSTWQQTSRHCLQLVEEIKPVTCNEE
jgi:glycosyl transferase family 5 (putative starch synthase catalytic subunit)